VAAVVASAPNSLDGRYATSQSNWRLLPGGLARAIFKAEEVEMKVSECMTRDIQTAEADQPIQSAAQSMLKADAGSIPVCDGGRVIGMITDRDLAVRALAQGYGPETPVRKVMSTDIVCCSEDDAVENAARKMSDSKVRRIPVLGRDGMKLVGILSLGDITKGDAGLAERALHDVTERSALHNQSAESGARA
jgi:CBS domain-containing protein